jgi:lauroyl/myristoyl acyltransferase
MDVAALYTAAWRHAGSVPEPLLRAGCRVAADLVWLRRGTGIRRLEANYARVRPELSAREVRTLSREGMRRYLRYFREAFTLHRLTPEQVDARVRVEGEEHARAALADGRSAVLALGHTGNWDLAGAWATPNLARVLTVAERLEPPQLYEEFVAFRRSIGIDVLGLGDDGVFRDLVRGARGGGRLLPLLADRDLTAHGIEVDLCGRPARVAAGPAGLAVAGDVELLPLMIFHERLHGERRRRAGSAWGIVLRFYPPVPRPEGRRRDQIAAMTQGWVDAFAQFLTERTTDWHMLQKVFVEDLDPDRDAATRARAEETR